MAAAVEGRAVVRAEARKVPERCLGVLGIVEVSRVGRTLLAKDVFNVTSTQLVGLQVKVAHDVPVPGSDAAVFALITAAEGVIVRAKVQVLKAKLEQVLTLVLRVWETAGA